MNAQQVFTLGQEGLLQPRTQRGCSKTLHGVDAGALDLRKRNEAGAGRRVLRQNRSEIGYLT